jgi:nucleoside-diphosphate-sugar epimerase/predicted TIM-barrel fold metal-dependent hydrolase
MFNSTSDSQPNPILRVVVGCGYVGQRTAERWKNQGDTVLAVTRSNDRAAQLAALGFLPIVWDWKSQINPAPIILDTLEKNKVPLSSLSPSDTNRAPNSLLIAVSHAVPEGLPPEEQHVQGLENLQHAMNQISFACRWIYLSTTGVFADGIPGALCDESSPVAPSRPGSRAALAAEAWFAKSTLPNVILRPSGIYGPNRIPNLAAIRNGELLEIDPDSILNLIHLDDLVAVIDSVSKGSIQHSLYCVCDGNSPTRGEYYRWIAQHMNWPEPRFATPQTTIPITDASTPKNLSSNPADGLHKPRKRSAGNKRIDIGRLKNDYSISFRYPSFKEGLQAITSALPLLLSVFSLLSFCTNTTPSLAQDTSKQTTAPNIDSIPSSSERTPSLKVKSTDVLQAMHPVVDVHTHFFIKGKHDPELLDRYVEMMDRNRIAVCVSLDGQLSERLAQHADFLWTKHRDRFVIFANMDFQGSGETDDPKSWDCQKPNFVYSIVERLRAEVKQKRISGLKFFKDFGLRYRNADGTLIQIDDPRWDPIWEVCGELQIPILIHTADPSAFFRNIEPINERLGELRNHPEWGFIGTEFPSRSELHAARNRVIAKHPKTTFIAAHFGNDAEDLTELSTWLEDYPNLFVEFSSRINELGRQPFTSQAFFLRFADRILMGSDGPFPEARLRIYWRFLETNDEYFHYSEKSPPPQGDWRIYGLNLPSDVLQKIYSSNATRLIPGIKERLERFAVVSKPE